MGPLLTLKFLLAHAIIDPAGKEIGARRYLHINWSVGLSQDKEPLQDWSQSGSMTVSHEKYRVRARTGIVRQG
jgi:hypothetical protein